MRRSSSVILAVASAGTLTTAWVVGSGTLPSAIAPTTAPTALPAPPGDATPLPGDTAAAAPSGRVSVDGSAVVTKYGTVQVQVVILDNKIVDLIALSLTDSGETSVELSNRAAPILREEVLATQSTAVPVVSSATYTSEAYLKSVQSALDAAAFMR